LSTAYDIIDKGDDFRWSDCAHAKFTKAIDGFLKHYQWLAKDAFTSGLFRWSLVQKFHMVAHLPQLSRFLSPRWTWTYGSESFQGIMVHLAASAVHGTPAPKVPASMLSKYRYFWELVLRELVVLE
jgi:hypothetical protein